MGASVSLGEEISLLGSRGAQGGILKINLGRAAWTGFGGWGSGVRPEKESGLVATKHVKLPSDQERNGKKVQLRKAQPAAEKGQASGHQWFPGS